MNDDAKIRFHSEAAARFSQLAEEVLKSVRSLGPIKSPPQPVRKAEIHPVFNLTAKDILGEISVKEHFVNRLGEETGRFWNSGGQRVGWQGSEFEDLKLLVRRFENADPIKGLVSFEFLLDEVFKWLAEKLELKRSDSLVDYIADRCSAEIKPYEIWLPVYRTYSEHDFMIGDVNFRSVSKAMLDRFYGNVPAKDMQRPEVAIAVNRKRSLIQGSIAACVRVKAELRKARGIAQVDATQATGLLRFLADVNWTCRLVSYALPVGREATLEAMELFVEEGVIKSISKTVIDQGPSGWNINEARSRWPGLLEALHQLASRRRDTDFRNALYGALQLHSRHSVAVEISHKMVLVAAAIESFLLKDSQEPIQKNLGERMAFLIGDTLEERKEVVKNVEDFYRIRSALIHHARDIAQQDKDTIDKFFVSVWCCFARLLTQVDNYKTRGDLLTALDNRKLS